MGIQMTQLAAMIAAAYAAPPLPTPVLLEAFDSTTGFAASGGATLSVDAMNNVQGAAAMLIRGSGASGTSPIATKTGLALSGSNLGVIAFAVRKQLPCVTVYAGVQFGQAGTYSDLSVDIASQGVGATAEPGTYWFAFHASEVPSIPATIDSLRVRCTQNAPHDANVVVDALYANAAGRATWVLGFDDGSDAPYRRAAAMNSAGFKATLYIPTDWVGRTGAYNTDPASGYNTMYLTWAQIRELRDQGHSICLDGRTDDDYMTNASSVAAAVANLQAGQAALVANGIDDEGKFHFCYPYGTTQVTVTPVQLTNVVSDGSATITLAAADVPNGATIYGAGLPVTGAKVLAGGGAGVTSLTLDTAIPARAARAACAIDETGPFFQGKLPAALKTAGFRSGRTTTGKGYFSRFGFGGRELTLSGSGLSGQTLNQVLQTLANDVLRGVTREFYIHAILPDPPGWTPDTPNFSIHVYQSFFDGLIAAMKNYRDNGHAVVLTKPQLYNRDINAVAP